MTNLDLNQGDPINLERALYHYAQRSRLTFARIFVKIPLRIIWPRVQTGHDKWTNYIYVPIDLNQKVKQCDQSICLKCFPYPLECSPLISRIRGWMWEAPQWTVLCSSWKAFLVYKRCGWEFWSLRAVSLFIVREKQTQFENPEHNLILYIFSRSSMYGREIFPKQSSFIILDSICLIHVSETPNYISQ